MRLRRELRRLLVLFVVTKTMTMNSELGSGDNDDDDAGSQRGAAVKN
jgi:hypothetical protein